MTTLGELVIRDLLLDPSDKYVVLDPHGWLQDPTFAAAADEFGITLLSAGPPSQSERDRVGRELAAQPPESQRHVALIVNDADAADAWRGALGRDWAVRDVQPITVFPGLDPMLAGTLSLADVTVLLPAYGGERRGPRSARETAWLLLEELRGVTPARVKSLDGLLAEAYRLHTVGLGVPTAWIAEVRATLPELPGHEVDVTDWFRDATALLKAIRKAALDGRVDAAAWTKRAALLEEQTGAAGTVPRRDRPMPWLPEIDAETVLGEAEREPWEERNLAWWLDHSSLLGSLAILRERDADGRVDAVLGRVEAAFERRLGEDYLGLLNTPYHHGPPMVHRIPDYIAARHAANRVAILVVDCLSIAMWRVLSKYLREHDVQPTLDRATFAWIPTMTTVSRQALLSGQIPGEFGASIATTSREERAWHQYWKGKGTLDESIGILKAADGKREQILQLASDEALSRVAVVFNEVDDLVHKTADAHALRWTDITRALVENWVGTNLLPAIGAFRENGWIVFVTSDHGAHKVARDVGVVREGIKTEKEGRRARIYSRDSFARDAALPGKRWDAGNTLPEDYFVLLAPPGGAYGMSRGWSHGGAAWDEVIVPFAQFGGEAK